MKRAPLPPARSVASGLLAIAGGLLVAGVCARHVLRALDSGLTRGKLGAVHAAPEVQYYASIAAGLVGIMLGCVLAGMGWRWLRGPGG